MATWILLNSISIAVLAVFQYLAIRQIGIILTRLGPTGARSANDEGPRDGEHIGFQMNSIRQRLPEWPGDVLYLFASQSCSICKDVRRSAAALSRHWSKDVQIAMIYDEPARHKDGAVTTADEKLHVFYDGRALRTALNVEGVPYGVRTDAADRVLGKGLVNSTSHVESLLELRSDDLATDARIESEISFPVPEFQV